MISFASHRPKKPATHPILTNRKRALVRALMSTFVDDCDPTRLDLAIDRLDDYLASLARPEAGRPLLHLLDVLDVYARARFRRSPARMSVSQREALLRDWLDPESTPIGFWIDELNRRFGSPLPTTRHLVRVVREMLVVAYYSQRGTDAITGYVPVWMRPNIRAAATSLEAPPDRLPVAAIRAKHIELNSTSGAGLFAFDGRPRVAVIGSGAGGAVVASALAGMCDVAVFEAGPSFRSSEYPFDTLAGMALLYEDGLQTYSSNLDVHVIRGRLVGGGTALASGMSIRTRRRTLEAWNTKGIDIEQMNLALDAVEKRLRLEPLDESVVSDVGRLWREGNRSQADLMFDVPLTNTATHATQHQANANGSPERVGVRCLGCGLCNYGCHFGHKLSAELTYLPDAVAAGARIHANTSVDRILGEKDVRGNARATSIVLTRDARPVPVDYVVLAAGAVGSPALLLRSMSHSDAFSGLPCQDTIGRGLGFNYGAPVVAEWRDMPKRPGYDGVQIHYIASKAEDEAFVLENAFLPPALMSSVVPGIGRQHRDWMDRYRQLGMAVNTVGSPQSGFVDARQRVHYRVNQGEMDILIDSLTDLVRSYLRAGAIRVGLGGVRTMDDTSALFRPGEELCLTRLREKLRRVAGTPDRLKLSSAHPQGGLRLDANPERGAVSTAFCVHGTTNVYVADASVFPSTIVINPQWTVMALATVASRAVARAIESNRHGF